jgi:pilus assembly protein CpaC
MAFMAAFLFCASAQAAVIPIDVTVGKSAIHTITDPEAKYKTVIISDPDIADAVIVSPKALRIRGKKAGSTDMIIYYNDGKKDTFDLNVNADTGALEERIKEIAPGDPIQFRALKNTIIVMGTVSNQERYDRIYSLLLSIGKTYKTTKTVSYLQGGQTLVTEGTSSVGGGEDSKISFVDMLEVVDIPQVLLQITVASIDRKALKDLGINWSQVSKGVALFSTVGSALPFDTITNLMPDAGTLAGDQSFQNNPNFSVLDSKNGTAYMIRALSNKGLAKVLAEPNLIVKSGEEGEFLAGGEFPIPIVTSATAGTTAAVTVVYKKFGVQLHFKPTVKETGVIQLKLDPAEVSALDFANAVTLSGFIIPALKTDTVSTSVDLREGESFVIAGLLRDDWAKNLQKFPILGDIPILGAFFRQQHMEKTERELVFLVTPKLIKPMVAGSKTDLPGVDEPSAAQNNDLRWFPMGPTSRSLDSEKIDK